MIILLTALVITQDADAALEKTIKTAVTRVSPSVVRINTVGGAELVGSSRVASGQTTGFVVHADGLVLTSAFGLAHRPSGIVVTLADGRKLTGKLLGIDRVLSIALIKVAAEKLPIPNYSSLAKLRVGQFAIALGRTLSDEPNISMGIISAKNRVWGRAIQTDAKISPANYGGPLIDIDGSVIGPIVPMSPMSDDEDAGTEFYDSGIGFAVPMELVNKRLNRLEQGDLAKGLLGLSWPKAKLLDEPLIVDRISWKSPAALAGMKAGDRIESVNGKPIPRLADFRQEIGLLYAGDRFDCTIKRGGSKQKLSLTAVEKLPAYHRPFLGLQLQAEGKALKPTAILRDSPAATAGLEKDSTIVRIADQPARLDTLDSWIQSHEAGEKLLLELTGGKKVTLMTEQFPEKVPKLQTSSNPSLAQEQQIKEQGIWIIAPAKPTAMLIWLADKPGKEWIEAAGQFGFAILGTEAPMDPNQWKAVVELQSNRMSIPASRTAVVGTGRAANVLANVLEEKIASVIAVGGPIEPTPAQPDFLRAYLLFPVENGTPLTETLKSARANGVPAILGPTLPKSQLDAPHASLIREWIELVSAR